MQADVLFKEAITASSFSAHLTCLSYASIFGSVAILKQKQKQTNKIRKKHLRHSFKQQTLVVYQLFLFVNRRMHRSVKENLHIYYK